MYIHIDICDLSRFHEFGPLLLKEPPELNSCGSRQVPEGPGLGRQERAEGAAPWTLDLWVLRDAHREVAEQGLSKKSPRDDRSVGEFRLYVSTSIHTCTCIHDQRRWIRNPNSSEPLSKVCILPPGAHSELEVASHADLDQIMKGVFSGYSWGGPPTTAGPINSRGACLPRY